MYFLDYMNYYRADSLKDNNGDDIATFDDISVLANVFRFLWMPHEKNHVAFFGAALNISNT